MSPAEFSCDGVSYGTEDSPPYASLKHVKLALELFGEPPRFTPIEDYGSDDNDVYLEFSSVAEHTGS